MLLDGKILKGGAKMASEEYHCEDCEYYVIIDADNDERCLKGKDGVGYGFLGCDEFKRAVEENREREKI